MPSKSPEQAKLMRAVAHGWKKPGGGGPSQAVAREFVNADKKMYTGGLAAMNLQEGGSVYTPWGDVPDVPNSVSQFLGRDFSGMRGIYGNLFRRLQDRGRARYTPPPRPADDTPVGVAPPPRIAPPPSRPPPRDRRAGRDTKYSQQLSDHKERIADILKGNARGGYMNYAEGGTAREDNPYPKGSARWKLWERKHGRDPSKAAPPAAPPPEAKEDEEGGLLSGIFGRSKRELDELENARGGRVEYRYGGLAQAAGRVPPMRGGMPPQVRGGMRPGVDPRRSGPKMQPPPIDGGEGIPGGPMVPPNMRGYLQKQRMMNRPPPNVGHGVNRVGGGGNRVGQQDQQGGLARALQRGTGRPPMSRRGGFPGR